MSCHRLFKSPKHARTLRVKTVRNRTSSLGVLFTLELIITYDAGPPGGERRPAVFGRLCSDMASKDKKIEQLKNMHTVRHTYNII